MAEFTRGPAHWPAVACCVVALAGCQKNSTTSPAAANSESADAFIARVNTELDSLQHESNTAAYVYATFINSDTEYLNSLANDRVLAYFKTAVEESKRHQGQPQSPATQRSIELLKLSLAAPAPKDPVKRKELSEITTRMEGRYGAAKYCPSGPESCKDQGQLVQIMAHDRNYDHLTDAWTGWHSTAKPAKADYVRFVELANEGARELGYADLGVMWRSGYDMPADQFTKDTARLWDQVKPLYSELHCYVRRKLQTKYGKEHVPDGKPIPAQLLGNLWAQHWAEIYDLVEPYQGIGEPDISGAMKQQKYDSLRMTHSAEDFYVSLGFPKLPSTFWERSLLSQPRDRDVQCHASAWQMDGKDDVRVKACLEPSQTDLNTIYHELGHVYYYLSYLKQPLLFQSGANDGFHEAIGDTINLSVTPAYLQKIGLSTAVKTSREAVINQQMKLALDRIAFLPFGKLIDEWRWRVFSGEIKPENYNTAWWKLREQYQGVSAPVARAADDFDPGAKYHVPANTPYTRYFLSYILQFQFHRALCAAAGNSGPLSECSIFGSKEAGRKFQDMLALGASQPWQDTLQKLTGSREMDASAITEYFAPLMGWLKEQNANQTCGW